MDSIETIVLGHPFWQGVDAQFVPLLADSAKLQYFGVDDIIVQERHEADHLYLVHRGQVALEYFIPGSGVVTMQILGAGEALGWSWLFPPFQWQCTARSLDATEIIAFNAGQLREAAQRNPAFGRDLVTRMAKVLLHRLQANQQKFKEFTDVNVGKGIEECLSQSGEIESTPAS